MTNITRAALGLLVLFAIGAVPAFALGPIDGEVGAVWWANEFAVNEGGASLTSDGDAPGYRAELWLLQRYGVRAGVYSSELDDLGGESTEYMSIDLLWRAFSPTANNFFAVGAGWEEMDLGLIGLDGDTSGPRISLEGRIGVAALVYFYGQGSYLPSMDDATASDSALGRFEDLSGHEVEVGVSWKTFPFMSLRAAYRTQRLDYTRTGYTPLPGQAESMEGEVESKGFLAGLSVRF